MTVKNTHKDTFINVRPDILVCLFLVIAILFVYWQVRNFSFVNYDDHQYVTENRYVQDGLTLKSIAWAFTTVHMSNWHPLTWLSHMLDYQLYGMNPGQHHLTNVLFHILNTLLLFLVFRRMTGELWKSGFVAALFALHPLHAESVTWVAERKDVLSTFFWLLTMWCYARYVEHSERDRYLLVVLFFILGLLAKPMLVTLPFILLLFDYWPLNRFQFGSSGDGSYSIQKSFNFGLIWEKIPLFLLSTASCVVTYFVQKSGGAVNSLDAMKFNIRIANAILSYTNYIAKMIWPYKLAVLYPYPEVIPFWEVTGACLVLVFISLLSIGLIKKSPYFAVGWCWFLGAFVPVIGLVQVGLQAMADRYTYVPLIGLSIIIAWGAPDILAGLRHKRIIFAIFTIFVILAIMIFTWFQVSRWKNSITLFKNAVDVTKNNYVAHHKLGEALAIQGETDKAIRHYSEALRIKPDFIAPHLNLGVTLRETGKLNEAIEHFSSVLRLKSDSAEAHYELGITLEKKGNIDGAEKHYIKALRIKPDYAKAHNNLGIVLAFRKKDKEALYHFVEALRIDSGYAGAYYNLGKIYANQVKIENAILYYRKALHYSPNMTQALYSLSWILATYEDERIRNGEEAVKLAVKLCNIIGYNQPLALDALASAYAETGKFDEAVAIAQKALELALKQGSKGLALVLKKRLRLFQAGRPYHQSRSVEGNRRNG
jgi:tetratricopeptide (TPR) repeat protein